MNIYVENAVESTKKKPKKQKKLLELINESGKVAGYKTDMQKSIVSVNNLKKNLKNNPTYNSIKKFI
jgi:hypothetical protein